METIRVKVKDTEGAKALVEILKTMNFVEAVDIDEVAANTGDETGLPGREDWYNLSLAALEASYDENEPEYTEDMIKRPNSQRKP